MVEAGDPKSAQVLTDAQRKRFERKLSRPLRSALADRILVEARERLGPQCTKDQLIDEVERVVEDLFGALALIRPRIRTHAPAKALLDDLLELSAHKDSVTISQIDESRQQYDLAIGVYGVTFKEAKQSVLDLFEKAFLKSCLERNNGNVTKSAHELGLTRYHLRELLKRHDLGPYEGQSQEEDAVRQVPGKGKVILSSSLEIRIKDTYKDAKLRVLDDFESKLLAMKLEENGGDITRTAHELGLTRYHLRELLRRHKLGYDKS